MNFLRGILRLSLCFLILFLGTLLILLLAPLPLTARGVRLSVWPMTWMARLCLWIFRVRVICTGCRRLRGHQGFVFPNHTSFVDVLLLLSVAPMRFLSKAELRGWPFIGWIAAAVGTVFVDRGDKRSREQARQALAGVALFPPVVLFPEGGIFPPANQLGPFRYGAFEIAAAAGAPYLPCVLTYDRLDVVFWGDESLLRTVWRLAARPGPVMARLTPLHLIHPRPEDEPRRLALEAHGAMEAVLKYGGHDEDVLQAGL